MRLAFFIDRILCMCVRVRVKCTLRLRYLSVFATICYHYHIYRCRALFAQCSVCLCVCVLSTRYSFALYTHSVRVCAIIPFWTISIKRTADTRVRIHGISILMLWTIRRKKELVHASGKYVCNIIYALTVCYIVYHSQFTLSAFSSRFSSFSLSLTSKYKLNRWTDDNTHIHSLFYSHSHIATQLNAVFNCWKVRSNYGFWIKIYVLACVY